MQAPPPGTFAPSLATKLNTEFGAFAPEAMQAPPPGTFAPSLATKLNTEFGKYMYPVPDYGQKRTSLMGYGGMFSADFLKGMLLGTMTGVILSYTNIFTDPTYGFRR
jgi:hypothetical protein